MSVGEFVSKLIEQISKKKEYHKDFYEKMGCTEHDRDLHKATQLAFDECMEIVDELSKEYKSNGWIPVSEKLPDTETEVIVLAKRKFKGGDFRHIITTAFYEDGTVLENDSIWHWYDLDGEWNEEEDCYIIPEGLWEYRHYNMDEVYDNAIDDEVLAWQPLPEPYKGE